VFRMRAFNPYFYEIPAAPSSNTGAWQPSSTAPAHRVEQPPGPGAQWQIGDPLPPAPKVTCAVLPGILVPHYEGALIPLLYVCTKLG
jgi:hypothetical protein